MADGIENGGLEITGWVTFSDGAEEVVSVRDVNEYISNNSGGLLGSDAIRAIPMGGGLVRLDVNIGALNLASDFSFDEDTCIPIALGNVMDGLRPDVAYYALFEYDEDGKFSGDPLAVELWSCNEDAIQTTSDKWELTEVGLTTPDGAPATADMVTAIDTLEDGTEVERTLGDFGLDPARLVGFLNTESGKHITLHDMLGGLLILRASVGVAMRMREKKQEEDAGAVPIAQYAKAEVFQNHDFSAKAIDGLFAIAMGEPAYELAPRGGKSLERYTLTASEDACTKLFQVRGANAEQVRAILGTVHSLIKNPRAAVFAHEGRVWFTVNHIAEELLRTSAGTIRAKDYPNVHDLVDAALEAASGAQVKGTSPDGATTKVVYLLDAIRLDKVTYNGETYSDVWGIAASAETLAKYAEDKKGHTYCYDVPNRAKPFTLGTVWIHEYLSDIMHEARGKLYTVSKNGRVSRRRGINTVLLKRAWQDGERAIFNLESPTRALSSRQKDRLVRDFEDELTNIVREEAHGERHKGMPLYVRAWSERDGGRGRGKGAYRTLCLEVSTTFRAVRDGMHGHGTINLRDGISKAAPENAAE